MSNGYPPPDLILVHISDLHFGLYLQMVSRIGEWSKISAPHDYNLLQGMEVALNLPYIKKKYADRLIIAFTGDLTNAAEPPAYEAVNNYIRDYPFISSNARIGLKLHEISHRVFFVPGNHDLWHYGKFLSRIKYKLNRNDQYKKYFPEPVPNVYPMIINGLSVTIYTINTNCVTGINPFNFINVLGKGEVGKVQIGEIQAFHNCLLSGSYENVPEGYDYHSSLKIALMHHHIALPAAYPMSSEQGLLKLKDAPEVLDLLCRIGIRLVLCGHEHFPYYLNNLKSPSYNDFSLFLSCAGSATQLELEKNSFCVYEITRKEGNFRLQYKLYELQPQANSYFFDKTIDTTFDI